MFQIFRDEGRYREIEVGTNDPQLAMVRQTPFLEKWLCVMQWIVCRNRATLPFLTSDNPAVMWADRGDGAEGGVGFREPALRITMPLTPRLCLMCVQTEASLETVCNEDFNASPQFTDFHPLHIDEGWLDIDQTVRLNQVTVANAQRYIYAHSRDEKVMLLLTDFFFGRQEPVRRFDRKPVGSPIA